MSGADGVLIPAYRGRILLLEFRFGQDPTVDTHETSQVYTKLPSLRGSQSAHSYNHGAWKFRRHDNGLIMGRPRPYKPKHG